MRRLVLILTWATLAWVVASPLVGTTATAEQEDPFPHLEHQGLFPLCTGCHQGIQTGETAAAYPEAGSCASCHDGVARDRVTWNGPSERVDNVDFDHEGHARQLLEEGDPARTCAACHIPEDGGRMDVSDTIQLGECWSCHAHQVEDHFADSADCTACHVPLAGTTFSRDRIESMPRPRSHEADDFIALEHGTLASGSVESCATCHTQEVCAACHVDLGLAEVEAMPRAPVWMSVPEPAAAYPEPASHMEPRWLEGHEVQASAAECSTCHTTDDCRSCHVERVPSLVTELPRRQDVTAPGVMLTQRSPGSHESLFFMQAHSVLASADQTSCSTCHVDDFCSTCHEAAPSNGYHPDNFMVRHSSSAYGRDAECANCHMDQVFCRACHVELGLAGSRGDLDGYHDASPVWLLRHGQAARQSLESCASCHRQVDCTRCHGVLGAFKVSPHSSTFDAERAWARSPRTCLACHVGNPLNGRVP